MVMWLVATVEANVFLPELLVLAASTLLLLFLAANLLVLGIVFRRIFRFAIDSIEEVQKHKKAIRRGIHIQQLIPTMQGKRSGSLQSSSSADSIPLRWSPVAKLDHLASRV